jgi:hypothetical protein
MRLNGRSWTAGRRITGPGFSKAAPIACAGVSADRLYGFGRFIVQSHRRDSVGALAALVAGVGTIGGGQAGPADGLLIDCHLML